MTENIRELRNEELKTSEPFPLAIQAKGVEIDEQVTELANDAVQSADYNTITEEDKQLIQKIRNEQLTLDELLTVLSKTVYKDDDVKVILFLANLLTDTYEDQQNVILTGESTSGKTFNIQQSLWFFRDPNHLEKIIEISHASPKSFIHQARAVEVDERTLQPIDRAKAPKKGDTQQAWEEWRDLMRHTAYLADFSNKIVVFLDTPDFKLHENLRSLLSHDKEICTYWITDKNSKGMNQTKTVLMKGYMTALVASTNFNLDDQESSRNFLVSPNDNSEKIQEGIKMKGRRMTDPNYPVWFETEPSRVALRNRVREIRKAGIKGILFKEEDMKNLEKWFFENTANLAPRANRDFERLCALGKAWALLNYKFRERTAEGGILYANSMDVDVAKKIYAPIIECNELGLSPEEYEVWKIIEPNANELMGLRISEIHNIYYYEKKRHCSDKRLREMLKNFVCTGLLKEEKEGVIIKYYPITHKQTKQVELSKSENNALVKLCSNCGSVITDETFTGLCGKCEQETIDTASKQSTGAPQ